MRRLDIAPRGNNPFFAWVPNGLGLELGIAVRVAWGAIAAKACVLDSWCLEKDQESRMG